MPARIYIGNEGEENAAQVRFDVSAWDTLYPDAVYSITLRQTRAKQLVYPEVPSHVVHAVLDVGRHESVLDISDYGTVVINCTEDDVKKKIHDDECSSCEKSSVVRRGPLILLPDWIR